MYHGALAIDHCFRLIEASAVDDTVWRLSAAGLIESSRRSHRGLGTANIFYCFDNAFLEILWIEDPELAATSALTRELLKRVEGDAASRVSPFGIGIRDPARVGLPFDTWEYLPPGTAGLPNSVLISHSSKDPRQPFLFRAQRPLPPETWTDATAGARQRGGGFTTIERVIYSPAPDAPVADLETLDELGLVSLDRGRTGPALRLTIAAGAGARPREFDLTTLRWMEGES